LDRFALSVEIRGIRDARERVQIMERNIAFEEDASRFFEAWHDKESELSQQIENGRRLVDEVAYTRQNLLSIAALTASLNVDGHRSDLVILKTARAQAAFDGRKEIYDRDIALAAEFTLPHRLKSGPFQREEMGMEELQERIEQLQGGSSSKNQQEVEAEEGEEERSGSKKA
jgi:Mg-chelatase subunit ChlI